MALIVQKFGGSSVRDAERIQSVAKLATDRFDLGDRVVVVVSAMGKTTDRLVQMAHEITPDPPAREFDMLLASGEQVSIALLAMAIQARGYQAISFTGPQVGIETDRSHGRARIVHINDTRIRAALGEGKIAIVAGFQGATADQEITTLGRGGSDTTGVALAAALRADRCDIYTDVDGVYTADPRDVPDARRLDAITYEEMLELASRGVKVLHRRSVELAVNYNIPVRVLSSFEPGPGTLVVKGYEGMENAIVSGVTANRTESKITIIGVPDRPGIAAAIFSALGEAEVSVDMIVQNTGLEGRTDISFTVDHEEHARGRAIAERLVGEIGALDVQSQEGIAKLSVVGIGMKSHSGVAAKMFAALAREGISIDMISTSEISISCLIALDSAERALRAVHAEFGLAAPATAAVKTAQGGLS